MQMLGVVFKIGILGHYIILFAKAVNETKYLKQKEISSLMFVPMFNANV